ncbi:MAG: MATE family multidrug resistance protein [Saprospiraceae bacterium]|jgi:MATE family multidrug resistance protein
MLAGPMILSNISVPLVGAVDTAVVGHLGATHYIGAVAVGALIFSFLYWGFGFLRMGTTGFVAQALGAQNHQEITHIFVRVVSLALGIGGLVILVGPWLISLALQLIDSTPAVEQLAKEYALIRVFSAPATLCVFAFTGVLIGMQNTKGALLLQLVLNLSNILLDLLFVPVLNMGVAGVAWATLISEYLAMIAGFFLLRKMVSGAFSKFNAKAIYEWSVIKQLMLANGDIFVRTLCLVFAFAYFTAQGAKLGELYLAVNAILLHFQSIAAYAMDGFAFAAEGLVGSAFGERNKRRFRLAVSISAKWAVISALLIGAIYGLFSWPLMALFTDQQAVLALAHSYTPWLVVLPIVSVWSFVLDGIFIGTTQTAAMRNAMLVSTAFYLVCVWASVPIWGNQGLLLSLCLFMIMRAVTLWLLYPRVLAQLDDVDESA